MSERVLAFEAVDNFRDYGDYARSGGGRIAPGRLLRSAHHGRATDADLARIAELGIAVVIDLRRASERGYQPSRRPAGFAARVVESDDVETEDAPHVTFLKTSDLTPESVQRFMIDTYRSIPFDPRLVDLYRRYFQALAETDGAVLIHCMAGKDRTGVLAALTHDLMGAHPDDLMADYLLTNQAVRLEERTPEVAEVLHRTYGRKPSHEAVKAFLGVDPSFLDAAFAEIRDRHGSVERYLDEVLQVGPALRGRIAENLSN